MDSAIEAGRRALGALEEHHGAELVDEVAAAHAALTALDRAVALRAELTARRLDLVAAGNPGEAAGLAPLVVEVDEALPELERRALEGIRAALLAGAGLEDGAIAARDAARDAYRKRREELLAPVRALEAEYEAADLPLRVSGARAQDREAARVRALAEVEAALAEVAS